MTTFRSERWRPTVALSAALGTTMVCLAIAVIVRRPDLVVVAVAFAAGAALPVVRARLGLRDELTLRTPTVGVWEGELAAGTITVGGDGVVDLAQVAVEHDTRIEIESPGTLHCVLPRPGQPAVITLPIRARHWGVATVGPVTVTLTAAHGMLRREGKVSRTGSVTVLPLRGVFDATNIVPNASGLVGGHRSRQPGSGTDLHAVRPFVPGDRLRRITWPVSLRTGTLHVATTTEDRETEVQLVVDSGIDVGDPTSDTGTSLDITVRSVASVAEHYLRQGDRVGLIDLGTLRRPVRLGAGRRHMLHLLAILLSMGSTTQPDAERVAHQLRDVPPRALVMVFSTLLDATIGQQLASLAQTGHPVLVVDTLPPGAKVPLDTDWTALAWRLALIRRDTLRQRLAEFGVPVVRWHGAGSLDQVLLGLTRAAAMPRRRA
jgi:uncharacterized protein (DUF58 family)